MTSSLLTPQGIATNFDWYCEQGELDIRRVPVLDDLKAPFDVTGWTVDAKIKSSSGGSRIFHTWATQDTAATGTNVFLTILPVTSLAWTFRTAWYRVEVHHPTDLTNVQRILSGRFRLSHA